MYNKTFAWENIHKPYSIVYGYEVSIFACPIGNNLYFTVDST